MAAENKKNDQPARTWPYLFRRCPSCGVKMHILAFLCWKCGKRHNYNANTGKWEEMIYGSQNENDYIYGIFLNDVDKCVTCRNTQNGKTCAHIYCFGIGKGNCGACKKNHEIRHLCCQEKVAFEQGLKGNNDKLKKFQEYMRQKLWESIQPFKKKEGVAR